MADWPRRVGGAKPDDRGGEQEDAAAGVQGAALLANTLRDRTILSREVRRLERWIDELA